MDYSDAKLKVQRMQKVIFKIMCDIDDFCKENNIRYYLSGGTCLGAVRHHGFIPWDDDGDLMMPRKDYEKFLEIFPARYPEKYGVGAIAIDPEWVRPYARVWDKNSVWRSTNLQDKEMGIFVDIFPIDGLPQNPRKRKLHYLQIKALWSFGAACVKTRFLPGEKYLFVKRAAGLVLRPSMNRYFIEQTEKCAKKYDFDESLYVGACVAVHYGDHETIKRKFMSRGVRLDFEGRKLPVPIGYKTYLSNLYGDYMTIPEGAEERGYSHLDHWEVEFKDDEAEPAVHDPEDEA